MGTPHRGSEIAYWTSFLADILYVAQLSSDTNKNLLNDLKRNSEALSNISQQFVQHGASLQIRTFYERQLHGNLNFLVCHRTLACS